MKKFAGAIGILVLVMMVGACETTPKKKMPVTPQPMSCSGGIPASITLYSPEEAKLSFDEKTYSLTRVSSTTGVKYSNGKVSYWNKGIDAMVTKEDGTMTTCTYIPKAGL